MSNELQNLIAQGNRALQEGRLPDAENFLRRASKLAPHVGDIHVNLGTALEGLGRHEEALREYKRAVAVEPRHAIALCQMGELLTQRLDYDGGVECAKRILAIQPDSVHGNLLYAIALIGLNQPLAAAEYVTKALEADPNDAQALALSGNLYQSIGRLDEALVNLRRSLAIEPRQGYTYYALVRAHRVRESELSLVASMEHRVLDPELSRPHRGEIEYALGKAYADLGDYGASMAHYDEANRIFHDLRFGASQFNREQFEEGVDFVIRNLDGPLIERYRSEGSEDATPVFVVGMIRSGTTLVEQILSSHPEIGAAGELRFWLEKSISALEPPGNRVNLERLKALEGEYLALLHKMSPGKSRVVDKMPGNFTFLGLIHTAFPNARIIHVKRNPIDTCLSIWMTPNRSVVDWANDKGDMTFAYKRYLRVMAHWRALLPSDRLLEIQYEELTANPETVSRRMVDFCGLPWNDACLKPELNKRAVATPSAWQVHQPIYTDSVERWRKFEPWLGEFGSLVLPESGLGIEPIGTKKSSEEYALPDFGKFIFQVN